MPGDAAHDRAVAEPSAPRPGRPERVRAEHHDARVDGAQRLVAEPQPLERARLEVLEHDVGLGDEPLEQRHALRRAQVDAEAALVAAAGDEAVREPAAVAHARRVGEGAVLDLDHVRALIGERAPDLVADHDDPEVDDAQPVQRPARRARRAPPRGRTGRSPGERSSRCVVLARLGRAVAEAEAGAVELEAAARQPAAHAGRDLGVDERSARLEVRRSPGPRRRPGPARSGPRAPGPRSRSRPSSCRRTARRTARAVRPRPRAAP